MYLFSYIIRYDMLKARYSDSGKCYFRKFQRIIEDKEMTETTATAPKLIRTIYNARIMCLKQGDVSKHYVKGMLASLVNGGLEFFTTRMITKWVVGGSKVLTSLPLQDEVSHVVTEFGSIYKIEE